MDGGLRIAMWSGPRNISTAMMRSWGNRADTFVCDEPLYAYYLRENPGLDHPGRDEVVQYHDADWRTVTAWLTGPIPGGKAVFYQKHMAHHLLNGISRAWLDAVTNCFLIRKPSEMLTSLIRKLPNPKVSDTGLPQQIELLRYVQAQTGANPPIIDARDILTRPREMLELLCDAVGAPFSELMLSWPAGRRDTDGIWAKHWYATVERSTGFEPYKPKEESVPREFGGLLSDCDRFYAELYDQRLRL